MAGVACSKRWKLETVHSLLDPRAGGWCGLQPPPNLLTMLICLPTSFEYTFGCAPTFFLILTASVEIFLTVWCRSLPLVSLPTASFSSNQADHEFSYVNNRVMVMMVVVTVANIY